MIDIHSHIIYAVDDGARSLDEAARLVKMDAEQGAEAVIATPHYYVSRPSDPKVISERLTELQDRLDEEGVDVELFPGNEVLWFDSMTDRLKSGEILTLAGTRFTLIEFYPEEGYSTILNAVRKVRNAGYRPVIAHAERFRGLRENGLSEVIEKGAYIQLSTQPFAGGFFDSTAKFVKKAVKNGECHFLGTDMHRTDRRKPESKACIEWITKNSDAADDILWRNAERLLDDEDFLFR